jgi:hypothetical protein
LAYVTGLVNQDLLLQNEFPEIPIWLIHWELSLLRFFTPAFSLMAVLAAARDCLRTRAALQIEVLALRHQGYWGAMERKGELSVTFH